MMGFDAPGFRHRRNLSATFKNMAYRTAQTVVTGEISDLFAHRAARFPGAQALAATIDGEFQQVAAFKCVKHFWPSDTAQKKVAQKMVNIPLIRRTMEAVSYA